MSFINTTDFLFSDANISDDINYLQCLDSMVPLISLLSQQILYALVCIVGLLGNTLVIYVVIRFSKMQTVTNTYVVNLAIANELFLITIPFLLVTMYKQEWIFGNTFCKLYMMNTSINQFASSIFLVIMSADRYFVVCHPILSQNWRTPFISRVVSLMAWIISAALVTPVVMYANALPINPNSKFSSLTCNIIWAENESGPGQTTYTIYSFILGFILPLLIIFVFYCFVIHKLITAGPEDKLEETKKSLRIEANLAFSVIIVYILCWSPFWFAQIRLISTPPENCPSQINVMIYILVSCLGYANSAINPILYAFINENFKKSFIKSCACATSKSVNPSFHIKNTVLPLSKNVNSEILRPPGSDHDYNDSENEPFSIKSY